MNQGVVVLERGYGWKDPEHTEVLPSTAMMRIARSGSVPVSRRFPSGEHNGTALPRP
jgi:hypothetical protein